MTEVGIYKYLNTCEPTLNGEKTWVQSNKLHLLGMLVAQSNMDGSSNGNLVKQAMAVIWETIIVNGFKVSQVLMP